jgi:anti-anti-sigma factor
MSLGSSILVGKIGAVFWMRVDGKGTFQNSVEVKRCFQTMMKEGTKDFVVDLECCPMMDSTFLGTLTGAALNLREVGGGVSVLNANPKNQHLLSSLGLDHILEVDHAGTAWTDERQQACAELSKSNYEAPCKDEQRANCREAHEVLAGVNDQNRGRFQDVLKFLAE